MSVLCRDYVGIVSEITSVFCRYFVGILSETMSDYPAILFAPLWLGVRLGPAPDDGLSVVQEVSRPCDVHGEPDDDLI